MTYTYKAGNVIPQHDRPCIPATTVILEVVITLRNLFAGKLTVSTLHLEPPFFFFFRFFSFTPPGMRGRYCNLTMASSIVA